MKKVFAVFALCIFLSGCAFRTRTQPLSYVVEKVEAVCIHEGEILQRTYTKSEKKVAVLNYLRVLRPITRAKENPLKEAGDIFKITVTLSNGETHIYMQKGSTYFCKDDGSWQNIDREKGKKLYPLLISLSGD